MIYKRKNSKKRQNRYILKNKDAIGALSTAIKVVISVVLAALLLVGLYGIVNTGVLPTVRDRVYAIAEYTGDNDAIQGIGSGGVQFNAPSVNSLKESYTFTYYSSVIGAVTDVNNGTTENADATEANAVAGTYTNEDGTPVVVLLRDSVESSRVEPSVDMILNLGGRTLQSETSVVLYYSGSTIQNFTIDGRLAGSKIVSNMSNGVQSYPIYFNNTNSSKANILITGAEVVTTLTSANNSANNCGIDLRNCNAKITNCTFSADSDGGKRVYAAQLVDSLVEINNCSIVASCSGTGLDRGTVYGVTSYRSNTTITNSNIKADAPYGTNLYYRTSGVAVPSGDLVLKSCNVTGLHSGVNFGGGTLFVDGGTYQGIGHGGFYFGGVNSVCKVKNALIKQGDYYGYTPADGGDINGSAFYVGGSSRITGVNVYIDNCILEATTKQTQIFTLRGTDGETNNTVYLSNTTIPDGYRVRIDNDALKLVAGQGTNITEYNVSLSESVTHTSENYAW